MYADDYESDVETVQSNLDDVSEADTIDQDTSSVLSDDNIDDIADPNEDDFDETTQTGRDVDTDTIVSDVDVDLSHLFNPKQINDFIVSSHPECLPISYDEMQVMLPITRNKYGIIIDDFHLTPPLPKIKEQYDQLPTFQPSSHTSYMLPHHEQLSVPLFLSKVFRLCDSRQPVLHDANR